MSRDEAEMEYLKIAQVCLKHFPSPPLDMYGVNFSRRRIYQYTKDDFLFHPMVLQTVGLSDLSHDTPNSYLISSQLSKSRNT